MDERENLPAKLAAQGLATSVEKRGSLVARGMAAVASNIQLAFAGKNDAAYKQAREIYNRLTSDGLDSWFEHREQEIQLVDVFRQLANEGYGKAYFPLSVLYRGAPFVGISDHQQADRFEQLAFDWLHTNELQNDPEIWHDLGALYMSVHIEETAIHWFQKAANAGDSSSMWMLVTVHEDREDWDKSLYWQIKAAEAGHENAQRGLEMQHERGDLESKIDDEQVFNWYVWTAEQGRLWAQLFLAEAFRCGDLIEQDDEQAAHWYLQAVTQDDPHAQLQLGKMYWEGRGVEQDYEQAEYWLENSADQGSAESQYQFSQFLCEKGEEEEKAGQMIQFAADQDYGPAQYVIASEISGFFDVSDEQCAELFDKALAWYEVEAKFDSELRLDLALMHLDSWQAPYNKSHRANRFDGLHLLEEVASEPIVIDITSEPSSKNDAQRRASRRLGNELLKLASKDNISEAIRWLVQAADLGDADACVDLAELYLHENRRFSKFDGRVPPAKLVEIDLQAAVYWFERGFQLGWSGAAYKLGYEYLVGKHLPQNLVLAENWLLKAANAGNRSAPSVLGEEYASGVRLRRDSEAAIYWLSLAAAHSQIACLKLASIYLDGKITPRNFDEAIKWLSLAAEGGFRNQAMRLVSEKCAGGQFSATEVVATQAWLVEMAAQAYETVSDEKYPAREADNAFDLGELYELGLGVEQDMEHAVTWYTHAAELDNRKAQTRLDELGIDWENT